ncbi:MAG: serine/threonine protein kinase, partial [Bradymonadaceae bacterium]
VERGRLEPELALRIAHQACGALVEAHEAGVVHRDMKAENLLLEPVSDGSLQSKIVDFGIAYPRDSSEKLTMTGRVYGTASYMAPEQARGKEVDERADLFSLGVMMFEMLVGRLPIDGANSMEVLIRQIEDGPPPLSGVVPPGFVSPEILDLVDSLIATDPADRPASAAEVRETLDGIFEAESWGPIRLETEAEGLEMFDRWIAAPLDSREAAEVLREEDGEPVSTTDGGDDPADRGAKTGEQWRQQETADATPDPADTPGGPPADGGMSGGSEGPGSDGENGRRLLVLVAIGIGVLVLAGVMVAGYFTIQYLRPEADGLEKVARPGAGSEPAPNDEKTGPDDEKAASDGEKAASEAGDGTDSVCGEIDRTPIPEPWRGDYQPQSDRDDGNRLSLSGQKINVRWDNRGGTLFLARTTRDGSAFRIQCARYEGFGEGEKCSGSLRRRGPVVVLALHGSDVCETRLSGTWLAE